MCCERVIAFLKAGEEQEGIDSMPYWRVTVQTEQQARQQDTHECGVFSCITALYLAQGHEPDGFTASQVYASSAGRRAIGVQLLEQRVVALQGMPVDGDTSHEGSVGDECSSKRARAPEKAHNTSASGQRER